MPPSEQPNWQPLSQLPLIASLIDGGVAEATAQRQILTEARAQPHLLDDATLDRVDQVCRCRSDSPRKRRLKIPQV